MLAPAGAGGQHSHVSRQQDVVDFVTIEDLDHLLVVRFPFLVTDHVPGDIELFSHTAAGIAIAKHHSRCGAQTLVTDRPQNPQGGFGTVGGTDSQPGRLL